jgi:F-type H+-transporting ATPase subunit epsilon
MTAFHFELVSPEKLVFSGEAKAVVVPGTEGEFTVLKDHAALISTIKPGIVVIEETPAKKCGFSRVTVSPRLLRLVLPSSLTKRFLLADLNAATLGAEVEDVEEEIASAKGDEARRIAIEKCDQLRE